MYSTFERLWVSLQDSPKFRRFAKQGLGSYFFDSRAYQQLALAKIYLGSYITARKDADAVANVKTFCLFIGHNKSGTSMLGALLDAHPNVILADEVDALKYVDSWFSRSQIFHILRRASRRELLKGRVTARRLQAYSWLVPNQWQGRYQQLQVVGDSTSGTSTRRFGRDPHLLSRLQKKMGTVNVKLILVIRNPFDPISLIMIRGQRSFENAIEHYFSNCEIVAKMRQQIDPSHLLPMRYEDFISQPQAHLTAVCQFLGIEASEAYLNACASILDDTPQQGRQLVPWEEQWIKVVEDRISQFDFLQGYSFEK